MAVDLSELIELRDRLVIERGRGISVVEQGNERVEFKNDAQMAAAIADLDRRISQTTAPRRAGAVTFTTSKGF